MHRLTPKIRKRILVAQAWWEDRIFRGIAEYAKAQDWILDCTMHWNPHEVPAHWEGDGIIAFTAGNAALEKFILSKRVPVVDLEDYHERMPAVPKVLGDDANLGEVAAQHLIARGFSNLFFLRRKKIPNPMTKTREAGFRECAQKGKTTFYALTLAEFEARLPAIPRPFAVFSEGDFAAIDVIRLLDDAGFDVPADAAVLGVDNTPGICENTSVSLSSIDCNFEKKGYAAAETLDRLMRGKQVPPVTRVRVAGVIERTSTNTTALPHPGVARMLQDVRTHFREPVSLEQLCKKNGVLLRTAQNVFKKSTGKTLQAELIRLRTEYAKTLLRENPEMKLEAVATESGFGNRVGLARAFAKHCEVSPGRFREKAK